MIQPTIGRQVWYWPEDADQSTDQPGAATVCYVHSDRCVNLHVINHNGATFPAHEVRLLQPEDTDEVSGAFCEWMPYQKGQAQKTDELAAAIASGQPGKHPDER